MFFPEGSRFFPAEQQRFASICASILLSNSTSVRHTDPTDLQYHSREGR